MIEKEKLAEIVGSENVSDDAKTLQAFSRDESLTHPIRPLFVVRPVNLSQVQSLINWANESRTPLITVSSGYPRFHGDSIPAVDGGIIVDMSGMKEILRVDRRNRVAMVEPGVTYGELIPVLAKEDLAAFLPLTPPQGRSVTASLIEREPITMPLSHWDPQDPLLCLEVVFGTGDLFRTGSAAGPGTLEEQWAVGRAQSRPMGPSFTDWQRVIQGAQGSMGIVTWTTVACRPLPKLKKTFFVSSQEINDLIELTYKLLWKKLGADCLILNNKQFASLLANDGLEVSTLRDALPSWILIFSLEGFGIMPEERLAYQENEFNSVVKSAGMESETVLGHINAKQVEEVLSQPSPEPYWKIRDRGGCHDIFFITTLDKTPRFITQMSNLSSAGQFPVADIGVYIQPTVHGSTCHCEFSLYYNPEDQNEKAKIRQIDSEASRALSSAGAFFSRPYGKWADFAFGPNAEAVIIQRKLKNMFDPNGIMNPGKLCF